MIATLNRKLSTVSTEPDLPIGYIGLSLGLQDPRGPPANWYA